MITKITRGELPKFLVSIFLIVTTFVLFGCTSLTLIVTYKDPDNPSIKGKVEVDSKDPNKTVTKYVDANKLELRVLATVKDENGFIKRLTVQELTSKKFLGSQSSIIQSTIKPADKKEVAAVGDTLQTLKRGEQTSIFADAEIAKGYLQTPSINIIVNRPPPKPEHPRIDFFDAEPDVVLSDEEVKLTWKTSNANTVELDIGAYKTVNVAPDGSRIEKVSTGEFVNYIDFTLSATNPHFTKPAVAKDSVKIIPNCLTAKLIPERPNTRSTDYKKIVKHPLKGMHGLGNMSTNVKVSTVTNDTPYRVKIKRRGSFSTPWVDLTATSTFAGQPVEGEWVGRYIDTLINIPSDLKIIICFEH
jgi:hypothetical protein